MNVSDGSLITLLLLGVVLATVAWCIKDARREGVEK